MKITAKLAYSQLKINRSRTLWTILAIALSTALLTAVTSFAASINEMLHETLGENYGDYAASYQVLLLIPIIVFGILIVGMSVTVISNVFRISTQDRMNQFGILKCTGATRKQIMQSVMYESMWLCVISIPIGLILGIVFAYLGVGVANHFLGDLNALAHMMIQEINISISFVFSWQAYLCSALLSGSIVFYSAWKPAAKAGKISCVACINGSSEIHLDTRPIKDRKCITRLFGVEGLLADKNLKRNRHNFRATVISLSVGVILFVSLGGLAKQAQGIQEYMDLGIPETVLAEYMSSYSQEEDSSSLYAKPIYSTRGDEITEKLEEYGDIDIFDMGDDLDTYQAIVASDQVTQDMKNLYEKDANTGYEYAVDLITLDREHYQQLCKKAKVAVGSTILLNQYSYNDYGHEREITPFSSSIQEMTLVKEDGTTQSVAIQGQLMGEDVFPELIHPAPSPVQLVVPEAEVRGYSWYASPEDEEDFMAYAKEILNQEFPESPNASYMEEGFNVRVFRVTEYMQVMNIAISMVSVFMYSFVALLMLIGLTNVISTLSTNVQMRQREFAVLKSVGMTKEGIQKMLNYESILCSMKALIIGIPVGILITILVNLPIRSMMPIPYEIPWLSLLLCVIVVLLITWGTTRYASHKLEKQNIIEAIRSVSGK